MGRVSRCAAVVLCALLAVAGCGQQEDKGDGPRNTPATLPTGGKASPTVTPSPTTTVEEPTSCQNGGKLIKGITIPGKRTDPVRIPADTIDGQRIPAATVPGVKIPPQRIPAQCVQVEKAPGGCLGAVRIPPVTIPAVTIPGARIPGVHKAGIDVDAVSTEAVTAKAVTSEAVHVDEVCQTKPKEQGEYVSSVYRSAVYRAAAYRSAVYRESLYRESACNADNECIDSVTVPGVTVKGVSVPGVSVPGKLLKGYTAGRSDVYKGDGKIAYNIKADVLFDFGKAEVKKDAEPDLRKVAASIEREVPAGKPVYVDGHTDAKGSDASNVALSKRRAEAVADWLATEGGIERSRLRTKGYGETKPVAKNTRPDGSDNPAGRAENRRVVIAARSK